MALSWNELSNGLSDPFAAPAVFWRAGSVSRDKKRAQALAYAEPRVYEDRLNEVLGPDWSCRFTSWGEQRLICELTVRFRDDDGEIREITRTSTGEFDSGDRVAQGTAAEAQAFKRACSKFGLGRYLYDLPTSWVGYDENTRRLTETPTLPARSLPRPLEAARAAPPASPQMPEVADTDSTLSQGRAEAMHRELEKIGLTKAEQRKLAERVLKHTVPQFSALTESEALEVWNAARRAPPKPSQTSSSSRTAGL